MTDDISAGLDDVVIEDSGVDDDNELALKGVVLLLNNKWVESRELFEKYKSHSAVMHFGGAFVNYMQAMMSMEEEKMAAAKTGLEEVEKKCRVNNSIFKRLKKKMKGSQTQSAADSPSQEDRWMSQIIVADSLLYQAVLTFINQDIPSYMKGGWLLRKAWKIYERVHADITKHFEDSKRNGKVKVRVDTESDKLLDMDEKENGTGKPAAAPAATPPADGHSAEEMMTRETLSRLLGAVCFGFGMFQLGLSMMPDKVLKLIEFLGFHADRDRGLQALEFSMESKDMRAPLAVLSVLWYHVLMKPFFTENFTEEEMRETTDLIDKYSTQYPQSSLFLFFKGRAWRLQKNLDAALDEYAKAQDCSNGSIELRNAALFEIAWCNMMKMNYDVSRDGFKVLLTESKWSKCFYTYMTALCTGALGQVDDAIAIMKTVPGLVKKKTNQIEAFASRRAQQFKKIKLTDTLSELLILELVYMWNNLPQCSEEETNKMISICGAVEEKKFFHVRSLIEGALYRQSGDLEFSDQCFKEALARHEGLKYDYHIAAHALFERGSYAIQFEDRREEGKKMLLKAKDGFKEYDFENRLNVRIRNLLKNMENSAATAAEAK